MAMSSDPDRIARRGACSGTSVPGEEDMNRYSVTRFTAAPAGHTGVQSGASRRRPTHGTLHHEGPTGNYVLVLARVHQLGAWRIGRRLLLPEGAGPTAWSRAGAGAGQGACLRPTARFPRPAGRACVA